MADLEELGRQLGRVVHAPDPSFAGPTLRIPVHGAYELGLVFTRTEMETFVPTGPGAELMGLGVRHVATDLVVAFAFDPAERARVKALVAKPPFLSARVRAYDGTTVVIEDGASDPELGFALTQASFLVSEGAVARVIWLTEGPSLAPDPVEPFLATFPFARVAAIVDGWRARGA